MCAIVAIVMIQEPHEILKPATRGCEGVEVKFEDGLRRILVALYQARECSVHARVN